MNEKYLSASISEITDFVGWLESRLAGIQAMTAPNVRDIARYCEFEADVNRIGVRFFRGFAHVSNADMARALAVEELNGFLKVMAYPMAKVFAERKGLAQQPVPKNITRHLENAFPQLRKVGLTLRRGVGTAKPSKTFADDENAITTIVDVELDDGQKWSMALSWVYKAHDDVTNATEVVTGIKIPEAPETPETPETPENSGIKVFVDISQQTGFTPRDAGFTGEYLTKQVMLAYEKGFQAAIAKVFGTSQVSVTHKGMTIAEIDALIVESFPKPAPTPSRKRTKGRAVA